jgi:hypothetical protein
MGAGQSAHPRREHQPPGPPEHRVVSFPRSASRREPAPPHPTRIDAGRHVIGRGPSGNRIASPKKTTLPRRSQRTQRKTIHDFSVSLVFFVVDLNFFQRTQRIGRAVSDINPTTIMLLIHGKMPKPRLNIFVVSPLWLLMPESRISLILHFTTMPTRPILKQYRAANSYSLWP